MASGAWSGFEREVAEAEAFLTSDKIAKNADIYKKETIFLKLSITVRYHCYYCLHFLLPIYWEI